MEVSNSIQKDFSANSNMFDVSKNISRTYILEYIKIHSPISIWDLVKQLNINRNTLYFILRDFQFCGLVKSRLKVNEHNRKVRIIYYNKKTKKERGDDNPFLNSKLDQKGGDENN